MLEKSIWLSGEFDRPLVTAAYFGFKPIQAPRISKEDLALRNEFGAHVHFDAAENAAFIRTYLERDLFSEAHPLAVAYKRCSPGRGADRYSLHYVGSNQGIADAILIRGALSILEDLGHRHLVVEINSLGDKESINSYERELHGHLRKFMPNFPENIRGEIKKDIFNLFQLDFPEIESARFAAPPPISSLSVQSRNYFKEVLEYLEALNINFRLVHELIGNKHLCSQTLFRIRDENSEGSESIMAVGHHYTKLGKRLGLKRDVPMAEAVIFHSRSGRGAEKTKTKIYKDLPKTKFCLVHLGREAKMRSLPLLEDLRHERIRVLHSLGRDKISIQLQAAENLPVTHHIIIGQREALENTATVRNVATRAQTTVSLSELPHFLKCLLI